MITVTPLLSPEADSARCQLLTLDHSPVLLDCGLSSQSPPSYLAHLRSIAPSLVLVLLTHPTLDSLACLAWLRARCGLDCMVIATLPTREMGRFCVDEWVETKSLEEKNERRDTASKLKGDMKPPSAKRRKINPPQEQKEEMDVDAEPSIVGQSKDKDPELDDVWKVTRKEVTDAFLAVTAVRWSQPVHLQGALKGYTLIGSRSGHTLGGTLWTLRPSLSSSLSPSSSASTFLYAPVWNHVKEHHLDGAELLEGNMISDRFRRMGVMVVGAERSKMTNIKRSDRDKALLELISNTLGAQRSLLLPTTTTSRIFELLVLLESHWSFSRLGDRADLVMVAPRGRETTSFLPSLTEWMGGQVRDSGGRGGSERLLRFPNLKIFPSVAAMQEALANSGKPALILLGPANLSYGASRSFFAQFAAVQGNVVILTERDRFDQELGEWLWSEWDGAQPDETKYGSGKVGSVVSLAGRQVTFDVKRKVILEGAELEQFKAEEAAAAEREAKHQAMLDRSRRMLQADSDSDSSDEEGEEADAADVPAVARRVGGFTGGAGPWDEFLDPTLNGAGAQASKAGGQSFDIYVKGSFSARRTDSGLQRFRMFPVIERKRRVDIYGEQIDVAGWLKRGLEEDPEAMAAIAAAKEADLLREKGLDDDVEEEEPPHRFEVQKVVVNTQCSVFGLDMEGKNDGRALKTILGQMNPRKLVIINGSSEAIEELAGTLRASKSSEDEVYTPAVSECITVGEETKTFTVKLGDGIMSSLRLSRVDDYDVSYVSGLVQMDAESDIPVVEKGSMTARSTSALILQDQDVVQETPVDDKENASLPPLHPSLFIGDLRLPVLKDRLTRLGVPTEFAGEGVLVCGPVPRAALMSGSRRAKMLTGLVSADAAQLLGGKVAVKKGSKGRIVLEGAVGETYFVVRRELHGLFARAS